MRLCLLLLGSLFIASNLYATGKVSISSKLQGTLTGKILERRLGSYVGKEVEFFVRNDGVNRYYTGTISKIIVPDIATFIGTGDQNDARLRAKLTNVVPKDPQDSTNPLPNESQLRDINIFEHGAGQVGHVQMLRSLMLGEEFGEARLIAKYIGNDGNEYWEGLIELVKNDTSPRRVEIENPYIVLLSVNEDFMEIYAPLPIGTIRTLPLGQ